MSLKRRVRKARRHYLKTGRAIALRRYLILKAKTGRWDRRYCQYTGVSDNVTAPIRRVITRMYAAGLVPTSTTGGNHATGSYHYKRRAVDGGLRGPEVGTKRGLYKLRRFQKKEYRRDRRGKVSYTELIGPINNLIILRGSNTTLAEGGTLEQAHDNHVHVAI